LAEPGAADDLDRLIRQVDPDRWLCTRFIGDESARTDVLALYAYDYELGRARKVASNPLVAEMRLTWWSEVLEEIFASQPIRHHPVAEALAAVVRRRSLPRAPLEAMIEARIDVLDQVAVDGDAAVGWAERTEGSAARLAAAILDPQAPADSAAPAGRAWGLALLMRSGQADRVTLAKLLAQALSEARACARALGVQAFPAALPARLARFDLAGASPGLWRKQLSLFLGAATGRL
jgi:phytoene synthase